MTKKTQRLHSFAKLPLAAAVAATMSTPTSALQFDIGDMEASLNTTLSAGVSWRVEERDDNIVGIGNGGDGATINFDNGNLNFDKGDVYSSIVKGNSEFSVSYEDITLNLSGRYWYDFTLKDEDLDDPLTENGKANASGVEVYNANVSTFFYVGEDENELSMTLGRQVLNWGESTFIFNGINVINPIDVGALRAPGAEIKEALLPVNMLSINYQVSDDLNLEAFAQFEQRVSRIGDCGTYFSTVDYVADGCGDINPVMAVGQLSEEQNLQSGSYLPRLEDEEAKDTDQYGLALKWSVPELDYSVFGFYYIHYHSRFPTVGGKVAQDSNNDGVISTSEAFNPFDLDGDGLRDGTMYQVEYPEDISLFGLSFSTTGPGGISLGGEYSFKKDAPVQLNSTDLVKGAVGQTDINGVVDSPIFQDRVSDSIGAGGVGPADGVIDIWDAADQGFLGSVQKGYDRYDISQLQFTGIGTIDQIMGASRLAIIAEVGATYIHDFPSVNDDGIRYGRFDMKGFGLTATGLAACQAQNPVSDGCTTDGYTTAFSWGYRTRAIWTYNNVFAGVNLNPQLSFSHDVKGYAPGPGANFLEGRMSAGLALKAEYQNQYTATLGYTGYFGGEDGLNPLVDRDNVSLSVSYSF